MKKKNTITIEDLAIMVNRGFIDIEKNMATKFIDIEKNMATKFIEIEEKLMATKDDVAQLRTEMQEGFLGVNRRIDLLHEDISDLPDIREELKDHDERLVRVERKVASPK